MPAVMEDLKRWGPATASAPPSQAEAEAYCRALAASHYENFTVVSWFLPAHLRQPMANVYGFCRWADDLGDETGDPARSIELLQWWRGELQRCFQGQTTHPVFVALAGTIQRFRLTPQPFEDLISAFEQDQRVTDYQSFEQLRDYCRRSADPVGRLVLALFEQATPQHEEWSDSICTGLQLANFWQDVDRDLANSRIYLPREDRLRFGYSDDDLHARRTTPAFLELLRFEVDRAREFFRQGQPLLSSVQGRRLRLALELFLGGGLKILDEIESIGYRVWDRRPTVTKRAKFGLLARSAIRVIRA